MSYDWKKTLVKPADSLRHALKIIDSEALRIALVTDEQLNLLGVLTDGDVRRALLGNLTLDDSVAKAMNGKPLTLPKGVPRSEAVKLMQAKGILAVPIVDDTKIVGLETLQRFGNKSVYNNPIFIMAGGFGTRLRPLTDHCPKPMLKIGDKPILQILLENFIKLGFVNFYISTHYLPEIIKEHFGNGEKWGVNLSYVHEETPLGTGGALGLLPDDIADLPIILMNGDVLTNVDFEKVLEFHNKKNPVATMCVRDYEYQVPFGVVNNDGDKVQGMVEKPVQRFFVNAGIYVLSPELKNMVKKNTRIDMPTLLTEVIDRDEDVLMFPIHEYWLDIGRHDDFAKAQRDYSLLGF